MLDGQAVAPGDPVSADGRSLSVTAEPITLEHDYLGPFEIRLDGGRPLHLDTASYRVIAADPIRPSPARASPIRT